MPKQRIVWADIAKYVCIMFVMLSHLESNTKLIEVLYKPFFLTVFWFVSGYVYIDKDKFSKFIYKKIRGLFIPWLVFSMFNIILSHIFSFQTHKSLLVELGWNFLQITGSGDGIWFVAALFVSFIPFYYLIRWSNKLNNALPELKEKGYNVSVIVIILSFMLSIISFFYTILMEPTILPWKSVALPWHLADIFQAMLYMVLGYYFKIRYENKFGKYNTHKNRVACYVVYLF